MVALSDRYKDILNEAGKSMPELRRGQLPAGVALGLGDILAEALTPSAGEITTAMIVDLAVTTAKLAANAVTAAKLIVIANERPPEICPARIAA